MILINARKLTTLDRTRFGNAVSSTEEPQGFTRKDMPKLDAVIATAQALLDRRKVSGSNARKVTEGVSNADADFRLRASVALLL